MTDSPTYPRPRGLDSDALHDAMWDLLDNGTTTLPGLSDADQWLYWLHRYHGFAEEELEVKSHTDIALIIGYKD